jgi:metal-responsive CopG/Arc/MetJ family transcriptional regulator
MKTLSLKLDEDIFEETEKILKDKKVARNRYINQALEFYNKFQKRKDLKAEFAEASSLTIESSTKIIAEFDTLIEEDEAI